MESQDLRIRPRLLPAKSTERKRSTGALRPPPVPPRPLLERGAESARIRFAIFVPRAARDGAEVRHGAAAVLASPRCIVRLDYRREAPYQLVCRREVMSALGNGRDLLQVGMEIENQEQEPAFCCLP
jgi:hypothetical protein